MAAGAHAREAQPDGASAHLDDLDPTRMRVEDGLQPFQALEDGRDHGSHGGEIPPLGE